MKPLEKLPSAFKRYDKMLGVLDFAIFEDAGGCPRKCEEAKVIAKQKMPPTLISLSKSRSDP